MFTFFRIRIGWQNACTAFKGVFQSTSSANLSEKKLEEVVVCIESVSSELVQRCPVKI